MGRERGDGMSCTNPQCACRNRHDGRNEPAISSRPDERGILATLERQTELLADISAKLDTLIDLTRYS